MPILTLAAQPTTALAAGPNFLAVPSLRQLLDRHPNLLVIDASSTRIEASLWTAPNTSAAKAVASAQGEASCCLPVVVARVLAASGNRRIQDLDAVAFCDGPGSVLGIRLAAASLRAWRAVRPVLASYSYASLPLLAVAHPGETIVADARRDTWHTVRPAAPHTLLRLPTADLQRETGAGATFGTPDNFRRWSTLPPDVTPRALPYSAAALLAAAPDEAFFYDAPEPDVFQTEAPVYATWTPRVHQSPAAR